MNKIIDLKRNTLPNYGTWGVLTLCLLGLAVLYNLPPEKFGSVPVCLFHRLTGKYCPGCGGTRATYWLLHGNFRKALHYNVVYVLSLPLLLGYGFNWIGRTLFHIAIIPPRLQAAVLPRKLFYGALGVIILFWILRNIPIDPFKALAP